jgi:hypothetical protein
MLYILCDICAHKFNHGSSEIKKRMSNECFLNVKVRFKQLPASIWTCTTLISLRMNDGILLDAYENGSGLPEFIYKGITDGDVDIAILPSLFKHKERK